MKKKEQWALLWSASQGAFHIETLNETIQNGADNYAENNPNDYILIRIEESHAALLRARDELVRRYGRHEPTNKRQ